MLDRVVPSVRPRNAADLSTLLVRAASSEDAE